MTSVKASKTGILKKKKGLLPSEVLEDESRRMEERLIELREHMKQEKERRQSETRFKDGSRWRGAVTTKPMHGYADVVLKAKPRPAPPPRPVSKGFIPTSDLLAFDPPSKEVEQKMAENLKRANTLPQPNPAPVPEPIRQFLESCGLEKHYDTFISNGIDDMEVMLELTEEHLVNLSLPLGHRIKLLKRIRDMKSAQKEELEVLPEPQAIATGTETGSEGGALLRGEYNEAESYAMFKDALDQFRRGGTTTHHLSSPKVSTPENKENRSDSKRVHFLDEPDSKEPKPDSTPPAESKGSKVWMNAGTSEWQPEAAFATSEEATESVSTSGNPAEGNVKDVKESCWECFKIFSSGLEFHSKRFCSESCKSVFASKLYQACDCGSSFPKTDGSFISGKWFCSDSCPAIPPASDHSSPEPDQSGPSVADDDPYDIGEALTAIDPTTGDPISI